MLLASASCSNTVFVSGTLANTSEEVLKLQTYPMECSFIVTLAVVSTASIVVKKKKKKGSLIFV